MSTLASGRLEEVFVEIRVWKNVGEKKIEKLLPNEGHLRDRAVFTTLRLKILKNWHRNFLDEHSNLSFISVLLHRFWYNDTFRPNILMKRLGNCRSEKLICLYFFVQPYISSLNPHEYIEITDIPSSTETLINLAYMCTLNAHFFIDISREAFEVSERPSEVCATCFLTT